MAANGSLNLAVMAAIAQTTTTLAPTTTTTTTSSSYSEISCDELNLIVLAQRRHQETINRDNNTATELKTKPIECQQQAGARVTSASGKLSVAKLSGDGGGDGGAINGTTNGTLANQQQKYGQNQPSQLKQRPRQQQVQLVSRSHRPSSSQEFNVEPTDQDNPKSTGVHFGAKVAL